MSVGTQLTQGNVDGQITNLSVALRDLCQAITNLSSTINGQGDGLAVLESTGYSAEDAAQAQAAVSYLNTIAAVYFGTAAQAQPFNFNNELSQYWGGR